MPFFTFDINTFKLNLFIRIRSAVSPREEINKKKAEINGMGVLSFPSVSSAHSVLMVFKKYKYESPGTRGLNQIRGANFTQEQIAGSAIMLPLPKEIQDSYSIKINEFEQGMFGDAISQGGGLMADGTISADKILENMGVPSTKTVVSAATGALGGLAAKYLSSRSSIPGGAALGAIIPGTSDIAASLEAGAGQTVNPKQALHFNGINMKEHTFSWTLAPRREEESDTILKITNLLKQKSLPSYTSVGSFKRAFLSYPSTVDIYFFGIDQDYFMYYKTCMINSVNFNYTPQGMAILRGGKPAVVDITIGLKEMDIHTAEDYGGSSGPDILTKIIGSE